MSITKHIPNSVTLLNLTAGTISVYFSVKGGPENIATAGLFIFIAALFDFLDGFAARMLNAKSAMGLQLDSLSDMVSFGVAPGFILYQMLILSHGKPMEIVDGVNLVPFFAILVVWGSAIRLAKFNIDTGQQLEFKGLPTPALAILIASLPLIRQDLYAERGFYYMIITNSYFLLSIAIFGSLLLISKFPMFSLKFRTFGWKENMIKYIFLSISLLLIIFLGFSAVPFILFVYLFFSLVIYLTDIQ
jgi:CDP-diacylglycerol--serine O-phosphatidyltransferase